MNFLNLKYFVVVAEEGNITRAARRLYISQQSLSNHIALLERELDTRLFDRTPVFSLTYAGTRLLKTARQVLSLEQELRREMDDIAGNRKGALRIGISHTCGRAILPQILPEFHKQNPHIELSVMEGNSQELEELLRRGQIDLMIVFTPVSEVNVETIPLAEERMLLVVPKRFSGQWTAETGEAPELTSFRNAPLILLKRGNRIRSLLERYTAKKGLQLQLLLETENIETAFALARQGMGLTVYPELFLRYIHDLDAPEEDLDFWPIRDSTVNGLLVVGYEKGRYLPGAAKDFIRIARQALRDCRPEEDPALPEE